MFNIQEKSTEQQLFRYKGFLYVECEHCHDRQGFAPKTPQDKYFCKKCGKTTLFTNQFVKLYTNCECGNRNTYLANVQEDKFDIPCLVCSSPIAVTHNENKGIFEPMRNLQIGRKKKR